MDKFRPLRDHSHTNIPDLANEEMKHISSTKCFWNTYQYPKARAHAIQHWQIQLDKIHTSLQREPNFEENEVMSKTAMSYQQRYMSSWMQLQFGQTPPSTQHVGDRNDLIDVWNAGSKLQHTPLLLVTRSIFDRHNLRNTPQILRSDVAYRRVLDEGHAEQSACTCVVDESPARWVSDDCDIFLPSIESRRIWIGKVTGFCHLQQHTISTVSFSW